MVPTMHGARTTWSGPVQRRFSTAASRRFFRTRVMHGRCLSVATLEPALLEYINVDGIVTENLLQSVYDISSFCS